MMLLVEEMNDAGLFLSEPDKLLLALVKGLANRMDDRERRC